MRDKLKLLVLLIIMSISIGDIDTHNSTKYRSLINGYDGFYGVTITGEGPIQYEDNTFNISVGDEVIWINDDSSDRLTIISDQGLWENDTATLGHYGRQFNYTFNTPGTYTFSIKQYSALKKQKIIVSDISTNYDDIKPTVSPTIVMTISPTVTNIDNTDTGVNNISNTETDENNVSIDNIISANPILAPLDILKNIKIASMTTFAIIVILSFLRKDGE